MEEGGEADMASFRLSIGMGGGFTGAWQGHELRGDGSVVRWRSDLRTPPHEEVVGHLSPEKVAELRALARETPSLKRAKQQPGNMSTLVELGEGGKSRRLICAFGQEPEDVKQLQEAFRSALAAGGVGSVEPPARARSSENTTLPPDLSTEVPPVPE